MQHAAAAAPAPAAPAPAPAAAVAPVAAASDEQEQQQEQGRVLPSSYQGIYPPVFSENVMVGIVSSTNASDSTWFGRLPEYVHVVNMLPFASVSTELLPASFVRVEYAELEK
jgi:hypothetical protein